jgi:aconitate hydratase
MQPRHLGIRVILVKSFARIHETNLKKQGMLALTFANEADYDKIQEDDVIDIVDLAHFAPDKQLTLVCNHKDGRKDTIKVNHSYNPGQILWFKAGSALNLMAASLKGNGSKAGGNKKASKPKPKKKARPVAKKARKKAVKKIARKKAPKKVKKIARKASKKVAKRKAVKATRKKISAKKKSEKATKKRK